VRAFSCPVCDQLVPFEVSRCLRCGTELGYAPDTGGVAVAGGERRRCANKRLARCNWLIAPVDPESLCRSCRMTRTRPNDTDLEPGQETAEAFATAEAAKRRLVFQLDDLELPTDRGPTFDLLSSWSGPVTTGHLDGIVTIDLAESDTVHRERMRVEFDEPYRTMLGHLRHETGHYYWPVLVDSDERLKEARALFGDDQADYAAALARHYETGPPAGWGDDYVSAYATAHPWEDWAETFAHYLHIRDTLQTAASFGMLITGPRLEPDLMSSPSLAPEDRLEDILADWFPLTYALNAVNRSMGKDDLYPFVLSPAVVEKLTFVHGLVRRG
jgi:hypothetical protein